MSDNIQLISDGRRLALIGNATDVERFFLSSCLDKIPSKSFNLRRVRSATSLDGGMIEAGSAVAAGSS